MPEKNYIDVNRNSWNIKTDIHLKSDFYDLDGFLKSKNSLNDIELKLLGDIHGKTILHLQCHFGQDTLSLSGLGAEVTGVDFSDKAIKAAKQLSEQTGLNAAFVCCDIYDLPDHLHERFDIVFTSYGTIGWLPDLDKWAGIIARYLKPQGKLVFAEFHPVVWMFDDKFEKIGYNYFNSGPITETEHGTYADRNAPVTPENITWNHGIGEVLNSLIKNGLSIDSFDEFDYSPYNCFQGTVEYEAKKFRIKHLGDKIPMVYAVVATKTEKP